MRTGKLDQQIVLQTLSETSSEGSLTRAWSTLATVFGHVMTQRGSEAFEAARVNARETIRVMIRYRADVTTKHRLQWAGQSYDITAVDRSGRREGELWLTAQVVGAL